MWSLWTLAIVRKPAPVVALSRSVTVSVKVCSAVNTVAISKMLISMPPIILPVVPGVRLVAWLSSRLSSHVLGRRDKPLAEARGYLT
jgi:hypothetical protein